MALIALEFLVDAAVERRLALRLGRALADRRGRFGMKFWEFFLMRVLVLDMEDT
jgi:hypothetical protein